MLRVVAARGGGRRLRGEAVGLGLGAQRRVVGLKAAAPVLQAEARGADAEGAEAEGAEAEEVEGARPPPEPPPAPRKKGWLRRAGAERDPRAAVRLATGTARLIISHRA